MLKNLFIKVLFIWVSLITVVFANLDLNQSSHGGAVQFDYINSSYLKSTPPPSLSNTTSFTIELWANLNFVDAWQGLFDTTVGLNSDYKRISINMSNPAYSSNNNANYLGFNISNGNDGYWQSDFNITNETQGWYHIALVYDSTLSNPNEWAKVYVDGTLRSIRARNSDLNTSTADLSSAEMHLGRLPIVGFNGVLDEFRIWNTARTSAEINATMNSQLDGNESGLVAYYNFDEIVGNKVVDVAGGDYNPKLCNRKK